MPLWILAIYCLGYYLLASVAINLAYHRVLSHRSVQLSRWFERAAVTLGLPAGTPIQWAGNHRYHHARTDVPGDPHSPVRDGFWFAHVGWYIQSKNPLRCFLYSVAGPLRTVFDAWHRPRSNQEFNHLAPDVSADPYYRWVSRPWPYFACTLAHVACFFGVALALFGAAGVAALWATLALIYNLGDAIDSAAHLWGERPYASAHHARNHWFLGIFTLGEGWHANHHEFPRSARHGLLPGQPDWTWGTIRALTWLGVASEAHVPDARAVNDRLRGKMSAAPTRAAA
jgi:stearoyl-CoA desaturase (delta-9 desaturase)